MYTYKAKIVRWVDGDTVLVDIDLGFYITRQERIRLARINSLELRSKTPYHVRLAKHVRAVANKICPRGSEVQVVTSKRKDMYARYIAEINFNGVNISDYLLTVKGVKEVKY